jgi:tetratricopeptide (TPR) repeat protein
MNTRKDIVDAQGNPIRKGGDNLDDLNLPPGVQALVETRINEAVDRLREHNQADLNALAREHAKKWRILTLASWLITIIFTVWAPIQIPGWIRQYVQDNMTKPNMERIADEAIRTKMGTYVDSKLSRVETSAGEALANVATLTNQVANVSSALANARSEFDDLSGNILTLRQFFNARRGDRQAYLGLVTSSQLPKSELATALLQDVHEFYIAFKNETKGKPSGLWGREVAHVQTLQYCPFPAENIHVMFTHKDPYQRQADVTETARRGWKYFVEDLVSVVTNDPNVLVASRAVSAIEPLTGKSFGDLSPFSDVVEWWQHEGVTNAMYKSPFAAIATADALLYQRRFGDAISLYENCVSNRPGLALTQYKLFKAYMLTGNKEKATNCLQKAVTEAQAQTDALFDYASLLAADGAQDQAVKRLAEAKPFLKDFCEIVKADTRFDSLRTNVQFQVLLKEDKK